MNTLKRVIAPAAALLAAGLIGGMAAIAGWEALEDDGAPSSTVAAAEPAADSASPASSIPDIVDGALPSVVHIAARQGQSGGEDSPFDDPPAPNRGEDPPFRVPPTPGATGSGWVLDDARHVVTNQHVVAGAGQITVTFHDGTEVEAELVGTDPSTDVAVLRLSEVPDGVRPLPAGSSESLRIGQTVIAIGSPFGLRGTVTSGIVSALDRDIEAPDGFTIGGTIQTDAALNRGNSGGPLLDAAGRVIGMNAQIASESGVSDGVGYAIPIETVREIAAALIEDGSVQHAYLGVRIGDAEEGAQVVEVVDGSPADDAGLRVDDLVVEAGGEPVESSDDLRDAVSSRRPGDELVLRVRRGDDTETVTVELGARPSSVD